ncbi:hypothetical protein HYDPIDRAFT_31108 [Hydnomerulius pinastri MD-312]|uniref:Ricin B lectin domain-containing protein n=1 Tax=Hydnomerulius pinastri MD-312 TaxID=994086 RepID=A0A0C9VUQ5_9AGAM|nr:hypothetical protein HYDPIDRAFT_31108 [Hydnomerulius pinastri MD-312]
MALLSNGQYRIFNAQFTTQDADLLLGSPTAAIAGVTDNSDSFNMVWNLTNIASQVNQFTLTNAAPTAQGAYASIDQTIIGAGVHGSSNAAIWTLLPAAQSGQYQIMAPSAVATVPSGLVWSLASGEGTQITLASIALNDLSQVWTFQPQSGNVARGLDELD